ncbi:MAG TPA: hypothetical protein VIH93_11885 [Thermoanaerobaculia bacterium]
MFAGHFAVAFGGKRAAPAVSLGTLFMAAQFLDLLWPCFLLLGIEEVRITPGITAVTPFDFVSYPYSHSLVAAVGWSLLFGGGYWLVRRSLRGSVVLGALVLSHWVLDLVAHRPDLPLGLGAGSPRVGLGLWSSLPATLAVELLMLLTGVVIYGRSTTAKDRAGRYGFWGLVAFLLAAYLAALFGPVPQSVTALGWGGQSIWLLVIWGYWLDRHRSAVTGPS